MVVKHKLIVQETRVSPGEADLYGGKAKIDREKMSSPSLIFPQEVIPMIRSSREP